MDYLKMKPDEFYAKVSTERAAIELAWRTKYEGKEFWCPRCTHEGYYQYETRPEVRECRLCNKQVRLRPGTIWQNSKLPMLIWMRAIFLVMQDKRGVSALQLKRLLGLVSYGTTWKMLHKIRRALSLRDAGYRLEGTVEMDGAHFHRQATGGGPDDAKVLLAVETKHWIDERGRRKDRAGFAKVEVSRETGVLAQQFVDAHLEPGTLVNTDGDQAYKSLRGVDADYQIVNRHKDIIDSWLPWVHRLIANAKTWLMGTHHGVKAKYLVRYIGEFIYRFNRRHAPSTLFHRALRACASASYVPEPALFG